MYTGNTLASFLNNVSIAVYPCVYREHGWEWSHSERFHGLSLCIQGTPTVLPRAGRFISVYPCVYREHLLPNWNVLTTSGLSLCIQGTQYIRLNQSAHQRFIPVYTGNTGIVPPPSVQLPVYPCVYREHIPNRLLIIKSYGLSLCIQGTQVSFSSIWHVSRFIPVYTGNTLIITHCLLIKIAR